MKKNEKKSKKMKKFGAELEKNYKNFKNQKRDRPKFKKNRDGAQKPNGGDQMKRHRPVFQTFCDRIFQSPNLVNHRTKSDENQNHDKNLMLRDFLIRRRSGMFNFC